MTTLEMPSDAETKECSKVRSCYDLFACFSNSFISGESMVITIELNLIFKAYYEEEFFNLEKYESALRKTQ